MSARHRKERDVFDDLPGATPELTEDFHRPCPNCDRPLVICADQPIRRVACGCGQTFTVDRRIGGELYLLRVNAQEYAGHRAAIERWKAWRVRILALLLALVAALSGIAACTFVPVLGGVLLLLGASITLQNLIDPDGKSQTKRRRARRRKTPLDAPTRIRIAREAGRHTDRIGRHDA